MKPSTDLTFIADSAQAEWLQQRWNVSTGRRVAICLDEAMFGPAAAAITFDADVEVIGLSDLGLSPKQIMDEVMALGDDLFPISDQPGPARIDRWMIESLRRWLVYAVHSVRLIESAIERFKPERVWIPKHISMFLTTAPDEHSNNPLFFDILPVICREKRIAVKGFRRARHSDLIRRTLTPLKYIGGQWLASFRSRGPKKPPTIKRPVILSNFDNDFHRQFDSTKLGNSAGLISAWLRENDWMVPLDRLLARVGSPATTSHQWFSGISDDLRDVAEPAGASIRPLVGLGYAVRNWLHVQRQQTRRRSLETKYGIQWWDLLFTSRLPYIHTECRLASAYYCLFEYERTRAILRRWSPRLLVASDYWTNLPGLAAAAELGIQTLTTSSGIFFYKDEFIERGSDVVCVYGEADASREVKGSPKTRTIIGGDVLAPATSRYVTRPATKQTPQVLFAMSARMFGWWFGSLLFNYPLLLEALQECASHLRRLPVPVKVVIKSHPMSDLHELYDELVKKNGDVFVEHRRDPLSIDEVAEFDCAVLFSTGTTFLAEMIRARVPVVYFSGVLTEFGRSCFDYHGLTVAQDVQSIISQVTSLLDSRDETIREQALRNGENFLERYVDPGRRPFSSVLEEVLGLKIESAAHSTTPGAGGTSGYWANARA